MPNNFNPRECVDCDAMIYRGDAPDRCGPCQLTMDMATKVIEHGWTDYKVPNPLFLFHHKGILEALKSGEIEGMKFTPSNEEIEPGDTYLAERNTGLHLLTCRENNKIDGWIVPVEMAYSYDTNECIKIELEV